MTRENFKKIIKLRSFWKVDKRKGDYKLPNGLLLSEYLYRLAVEQMDLDRVRIAEDGNLYFAVNEERKWKIMKSFSDNESCSSITQWYRIDSLVREMLY